MRGGRFQEYRVGASTGPDAVDVENAIRKEQCEQRLARIANGKEPSHKNTPWPGQEKGKPMK